MKKLLKNKKIVSGALAVLVLLILFIFGTEGERQEIINNLIDVVSESAYEVEEEELPLASLSSIQKVSLDRVVDGDTIVVEDMKGTSLRIRLIGIDTPESVSPDKEKNTVYGEYASDYVKELLENIDYLYLEYDVEETDSFDRILAYVWLNEDMSRNINMLNYKIVYEGYGINKEYPPNTKYAEIFQDARQDAADENRGLWLYEGYEALVE